MSKDSTTLVAPVPWGGGTNIPGTPFRVAVSAAATEGRAVVITVDMAPGVHVDEHTHSDEDQIMIVVSGRLGTNVGGVESVLEAGEVQLLPRGVPHALWNAGDEFAKVIDIYTPPGMEQRFAQAGAAAQAAGAAEASGDDYRSSTSR